MNRSSSIDVYSYREIALAARVPEDHGVPALGPPTFVSHVEAMRMAGAELK